MPYADPEKARARRRNRENIRRATLSDITAEQELAMRRKARKCPLCDVWMTSTPHLPNSKELDHILQPAPRQPRPRAKPVRLCPDCGQPKQASQCQPCTTARAWQAVELRQAGLTLAEIGAQLGYRSETSVTNLLKTVVDVKPYARGVTVGDDYRETHVNA